MTSTVLGVPVWNGASYLEECVASLLDQTVAADEIVIADNGSTDASATIAAGLAAAEPRVRLVRRDHNIGAAANFNRLVEETDGDLFAWVPHDDRWSPRLLEEARDALADPTVAVAYGRPSYIDADGHPDGGPEPAIWTDAGDPVTRVRELFADPVRSHLHVCIPVLGVMRRSALLDTGLIRPFGGSDKVLIVELALRGRITPLAAPFHRRRHASSSVRANPDGEARRRWFDPAAEGPALPLTRLTAAYLGAVRRSPLSARDRAACAAVIGRWACGGRRPRVVAGELAGWVRHETGRLVADRGLSRSRS